MNINIIAFFLNLLWGAAVPQCVWTSRHWSYGVYICELSMEFLVLVVYPSKEFHTVYTHL